MIRTVDGSSAGLARRSAGRIRVKVASAARRIARSNAQKGSSAGLARRSAERIVVKVASAGKRIARSNAQDLTPCSKLLRKLVKNSQKVKLRRRRRMRKRARKLHEHNFCMCNVSNLKLWRAV